MPKTIKKTASKKPAVKSDDPIKQLPKAKATAHKMSKQSEGTLQKIGYLASSDAECQDILQQINSVIGMLKKARKDLMSHHLENCIPARIVENKQKALKELLKLYEVA